MMAIQIEFLTSAVLSQKHGKAKIGYLLDMIRQNKILVLEDPLPNEEETALIEETMRKVSSKFPGIEIGTLGNSGPEDFRGQLIKLLGGKTGGLTVIGPSHLVRAMKRDPKSMSIFASDGRRKK